MSQSSQSPLQGVNGVNTLTPTELKELNATKSLSQVSESPQSFVALMEAMMLSNTAGVSSGGLDKQAYNSLQQASPIEMPSITLQAKVEKTVVEVPPENTKAPITSHKTDSAEDTIRLNRSDLNDTDWQMLQWLAIPSAMPAQGIPIQQFFQMLPQEKLMSAASSQWSHLVATEKLKTLIEEAQKTGRTIRVDLDEDAALLLKIRNQKVSAEFVTTYPSPVLQQQLDQLKHRMQAKQLPVDDLLYRQSRGNPKQHTKDSGESDDNT